MKRALWSSLCLCFCLVGVALLAQSDLLNLHPVRTEARKLLAARQGAAPGQAFDLPQLKQLHRAIVGNRPNVWAMPEPMRRSLQDELEPLRATAAELAASANADERFYAALLNSYLRQTDDTRALLLKLAHDETSATAGTAMDTLFGLKRDTPALRAELVQALQENPPPKERRTLRALAKNNIGTWGVQEAVPVLIKQLEASAAGANDNGPGKAVDRDVVRQLKALGPEAASALPLLRQLLEKRKAQGNADFREIEDLEHAVLVVSGEYKPPHR